MRLQSLAIGEFCGHLAEGFRTSGADMNAWKDVGSGVSDSCM